MNNRIWSEVDGCECRRDLAWMKVCYRPRHHNMVEKYFEYHEQDILIHEWNA